VSREKSGGLSVSTLLIASGSAAAAAVIVPTFWARGGVVAAAVTPVIVTLFSEALRHPVERVSTVGVWRKTPQGTAIREPAERDFDPLDPHDQRLEVDPEQPDDPFGLHEPERPRLLRRRNVVLALVTGALAFGIAAVVVTASELAIFGDSVSAPSRTTFFGGKQRAEKDATPTPTPTPTAEAEEATPAPEATEATPTTTPQAEEATPAPSVAPEAQTTPAAPTPAPTP
jgi:uncharacterized membrane protein